MSIISIFKQAGFPQRSYAMRGQLYLSRSGWILLRVPNALVRGVFATIGEPGLELPANPLDGKLDAHVSVIRPGELEAIGGPDKITERGRDFSYTLGPLRIVNSPRQPELSKAWYIEVASPELAALRKSYGLPGLPNNGKYQFHITVAVRRTHVLGENDVSKIPVQDSGGLQLRGSDPTFVAAMDGGESGPSRTFPARKAASYSGIPLRPAMLKMSQSCPACGNAAHEIHGKVICGSCGQIIETCCDGGKQASASLAGTIADAVKKIVPPKSRAQADAGNYPKGHVAMHGFDVAIETAKGQKRQPEFPALKHNYGYIKRTTGKDGDHVDVFVGDNAEVELVYVVDQIDPDTKRFDEHKVMLGFTDLASAKAAYLANYEKGWQGLADITPLTMQQFKEWIKDGNLKKPIAKQTFTVKAATAPILMLPVGDRIDFCFA